MRQFNTMLSHHSSFVKKLKNLLTQMYFTAESITVCLILSVMKHTVAWCSGCKV